MKLCKKHNIDFETRECLLCKKEYNKKYYEDNAAKIIKKAKEYSKTYYLDNKNDITIRHKKYVENNKDSIKKYSVEYNKIYYQENKEEISKRQKSNKSHLNKLKSNWASSKRKNDPAFKLRADMSSAISRMLKLNISSKNGNSVLDFLPYSFEQLKEHLEKLFESWMTWNNQGKYNSNNWNDIDQTTWTWQLDHIIPQSDLPYLSMTDGNFQKCWALDNLRPLSAKQNLIDGSTRKRHLS